MGRRGRPYSQDKRKKQCMIRINTKEDRMLADTCKMTGMGQADVFRTALERMYHAEAMIKGEQEECDKETLEKGLTLTKDLDVYGVDRVKLIKEEEFPKWDERRNDIYE